MVERRNTFGTTFRNTRTGETGKGIEDLMALTDFPRLQMEYNSLNAQELNPVVLDCIDPALDIQTGDGLNYPYRSDTGEDENRMRVSAVQPVTLSDVEVRRFLLIYSDPAVG